MKTSMSKSQPAPTSETKSSAPYCPDTFDLVWLNFDPQVGREQAGRRPAFVLSARSYNQKSGLCVVCPVTSQVKGYPFEVTIPSGAVEGVVLADQVKSLAWFPRDCEFITTCAEIGDEVMGKLESLLP